MKQLYTRWGREMDPEHVLPEYPRPLLVRENYTNLNGYWEYGFTEEYREPEKYQGKILVPFSAGKCSVRRVQTAEAGGVFVVQKKLPAGRMEGEE